VVKIKRTDQHIVLFDRFDQNCPKAVAHYAVEGESRRLVVETYLTEELIDGDEVPDFVLGWMDEDAQWAANHPDDVPEAKLVCT
jgi:hypothetical protein